MVIKGLIREGEGREVGQIRLGRTKTVTKNGREVSYPEKLDYFEILHRNPNHGNPQARNHPDADKEFIRDSEMHAKLGERPRRVEVYLAADHPDTVFHTELGLYRSKNKPRFCSGDGEVARVTLFPGDACRIKDGTFLIVARPDKNGELKVETERKLAGLTAADLDHNEDLERDGDMWRCANQATKVGPVACSCPLIDKDAPPHKRCKPHGILRVMLKDAGEFGPVHVFRTTSWNTIRSIANFLNDLYGMVGFLKGIPGMVLACEPKMVTAPDGKQQRAFIAHLLIRATPEKVLESTRRLAALRQETLRIAGALTGETLPVPDLDAAEAAQDLVPEFHPEAEDAEFEVEGPETEPPFEEGGGPDRSTEASDSVEDPFLEAEPIEDAGDASDSKERQSHSEPEKAPAGAPQGKQDAFDLF